MDKPNNSILNASCTGWYPEAKNELKSMVEDLLNKAKSKSRSKPFALIVPHAGLLWSGETAAYGYKELISSSIKDVFILGPAHRFYTDRLILPKSNSFKTPLGILSLNDSIKKLLLKEDIFEETDKAFYAENSIELQLPLLQMALPDCKIIPIVIGQLNKDRIKKAAEILKDYLLKESIFIISSDFTHYGARFGYLPFSESDKIEEDIKKLDYKAIEEIEKLDPDGFLEYLEKTGATICGSIPIAILLSMLAKDTEIEVLCYNTSGKMTANFSTSISYTTIGFYKDSIDKENSQLQKDLTEKEQKTLLRISRAVLEDYIKRKKQPKIEDLDIALTENMKKDRGAFVTLHKNGQLRGCIGEILPKRPLYQVIIDRTIDAAVNDSRFPQVLKEELKDIVIEISALTPPKKIGHYRDIVLGRDGILLKKGSEIAVFLPQVATEQNWDLDTTLSHLSSKAGLNTDAYKENAEFEVFQAEVFSE